MNIIVINSIGTLFKKTNKDEKDENIQSIEQIKKYFENNAYSHITESFKKFINKCILLKNKPDVVVFMVQIAEDTYKTLLEIAKNSGIDKLIATSIAHELIKNDIHENDIHEKVLQFDDRITNLYVENNIDIHSFDEVTKIILPKSIKFIRPLMFKKLTEIESLTKIECTNEYYKQSVNIDLYNTIHNKFKDFTNISPILSNADIIGKSSKDIEELIKQNNIKVISAWLFDSIEIESITLPDCVVKLSDSSFQDCTSVENIILPTGLSAIGKSAFQNTQSLEKLNLQETRVKYINDDTFHDSGVKNVILPNDILSIGAHAFNNCGLIEITLPDSITHISNSAFEGCSSLTKINIPRNITEICDGTFYKCVELSNWDFNKSKLQVVGNDGFHSCFKLTSFDFSNLVSIGSCAFMCTGIKEIHLHEIGRAHV